MNSEVTIDRRPYPLRFLCIERKVAVFGSCVMPTALLSRVVHVPTLLAGLTYVASGAWRQSCASEAKVVLPGIVYVASLSRDAAISRGCDLRPAQKQKTPAGRWRCANLPSKKNSTPYEFVKDIEIRTRSVYW